MAPTSALSRRQGMDQGIAFSGATLESPQRASLPSEISAVQYYSHSCGKAGNVYSKRASPMPNGTGMGMAMGMMPAMTGYGF
ncbi:hypothetical protein F5I97DRAFT_1923168 [Phlebopus sp. FC_14]|nr:hypothetical protein F5I97DRAFT_1923168 [Phlebopus sp. FC_14]